jgi:hypothetical protein
VRPVTLPTVSVVVPLYNKGPYVLRAISSILVQTIADLEVIVVDDGSTDEGPALVRRLSDPRIRIVRQVNGGPGLARNRGVAEARAPYVAFLDADDEWLPVYLEAALAQFERHGAEIVAVSFAYTSVPSGDEKSKRWKRWGLVHGIQDLSETFAARRVIALLEFMSPCATVLRTEEVRRWGGFYDRDKCLYAEDTFLWLQLIFNGKVLTDARPLVRVFTAPSALSGNFRKARPVEPFLTWPDLLELSCPDQLKTLLATVLKLRALKTTCVLGYWGDWRTAQSVLRRHCTIADVRLPLFLQAGLLSTRAGGAVGAAIRFWQRTVARALGRITRRLA